MAGSLNKVSLIGNLGKDPIIRSMGSNGEVASFSIATGESWVDKNTGERRERTEWHQIVVYNQNLVKLVSRFVKKGSKVYVEGSLQTRKWTDSTSGQERYVTEVVVHFNGMIVLLDKRSSPNDYDSSFNENGTKELDGGNGISDDEIPF